MVRQLRQAIGRLLLACGALLVTASAVEAGGSSARAKPRELPEIVRFWSQALFGNATGRALQRVRRAQRALTRGGLSQGLAGLKLTSQHHQSPGERHRALLYAGILHSEAAKGLRRQVRALAAEGRKGAARLLQRKQRVHRRRARQSFARLADAYPGLLLRLRNELGADEQATVAHITGDIDAAVAKPTRYLFTAGDKGPSLWGRLGGLLSRAARVPLGQRLQQWLFGLVGSLRISGNAAAEAAVFIACPEGNGSGVAYRSPIDGRVRLMTNQHVVEGTNEVTVAFASGGPPIRALVVGGSRFHDVAVLEPLEALPSKIRPLVLRRSPLVPGERVAEVGHPDGGDHDGRDPHVLPAKVVRAREGDVVRTDAHSSPGSSGSPNVDKRRRLAGLDAVGGGSGSWLTGFRPTSQFIDLLGRMERGHIECAELGLNLGPIQVVEAGRAKVRSDAVGVDQVTPNSPAEKAGLRAGDRVLAIEAISLPGGRLDRVDRYTWPQAISRLRINEPVRIEVQRGDRRLTFHTKAVSSHEIHAGMTRALGLGLKRHRVWVTPQDGGDPRPDSGLKVTRVQPGSPAASLGLQAGDVIVGAVQRVEKGRMSFSVSTRGVLVAALANPSTFRLHIQRDGQPKAIRLNSELQQPSPPGEALAPPPKGTPSQ
jgi:serine protease Do